MRFVKLEKNNPSALKKKTETTSIKMEITISPMPTPPKKKDRLCTGMAVMISSNRNTIAELSLPNTKSRPESRVVRSRSNVWRSRSEEIAHEVRAGAIKLTMSSSSKTTVLKMILPTTCK